RIAAVRVTCRDQFHHRILEFPALRPFPVAVPALAIVGPSAAARANAVVDPGIDGDRWNLARVAGGAILSEYGLAACDLVEIKGSEEWGAARCIGQGVGPGRDEEEHCHVRGPVLGGLPIDRLLLGIADLDRRDLAAADERTEVQQPLLA